MQEKGCRKHKGAKVEAWTLKGFIADSKNELANALEERERCPKEGKKPIALSRRSSPQRWIVLPRQEERTIAVRGFARKAHHNAEATSIGFARAHEVYARPHLIRLV
jgi:hypothetical protein